MEESRTSSATGNRYLGLGGSIALLALLILAVLGSNAAAAEPLEPPVYSSSFGPDGTEATDFGLVSSLAFDQQTGALYVLDREAGALYKFDEDGQPLDFTGTESYIDDNRIEGIVLPSEGAQIAVDPASHVVYVTEKNAVRAFEADGEPHEFTDGPGDGTSKIPGFSGSESFSEQVYGVAVDAFGAIYVTDRSAGFVYIFRSTGEPITKFEGPYHEPDELTVSTNGVAYIAYSRSVYKFTPSSYPVNSTTTYTPRTSSFGFLESISEFGTVGIDSDRLSGDVYMARDFQETTVDQFDKTGAFIRDFDNEGGVLRQPQGIAVNGAAGKFYVGNNDVLAGSSKIAIFDQPIYLPFPPTIESTSALNITADSAKLRAKINPNTLDTTYRFEYGFEDCSLPTAACTEITPTSPDIGSGHKGVFAFAQLTGLQAGTTYHFRVIAENSLALEPIEGPDTTFTTQVSALGFQLPDSRAWEMVSPPSKHGGKLLLHFNGAVVQAASDGNGLAYSSYGSIEAAPDGNRIPEQSQLLARRGGDGWHTKDITPPHTEATAAPVGEYRLFGPDLSRALLNPRDATPHSPQADERTPYVRDNTEPGTYTPLMTNKEGFANVPTGVKFGEQAPYSYLQGGNPQLTHIVFSTPVPLLNSFPGGSFYMWNDGELSLVGELPASEGGEAISGYLGSGSGSVRHAVSDDGSRVFWSNGEYLLAYSGLTALYLRDTEAEETVRLDVAQPGVGGAGETRPTFQGASADGTVVYFTDPQQLTADASLEGRSLYRCEIPAGASAQGCSTLTNISVPLAGSGESAKVQDIAPALSDDGSRIYFVAEGKLDAKANEEGDFASAGEPNLYLWEEGAGTRFIALLSDDDRPNWGQQGLGGTGNQVNLTATASPAGRYLTFMSQRSLTGYDNQDAASGEPNQEIFRYDATSEELACVSCNPSGASPAGEQLVERYDSEIKAVDRRSSWSKRWVAATVPETGGSPGGGSENTLVPPRATLDNGRVFFNAIDSLVPADSNGEWDVYQWEPLGVGDCSPSSGGASISRSGNGCVSLLSSGTADEEAAFLDASESGDDVFFLTKARLSVLDEDTELDVYDARVNGVPEKLTPRTECLGEACQPVPSPPSDPTPASASFEGAGNEPSTRCPKGKKRQLRNNGSSRCVAQKKHKKKAHKAKRAADKRRAGR